MAEAMQTLRDLAGSYLTVHSYDVEELKLFLETARNAELSEQVQSDLAETINGDGLSQEAWEEITEDDFDTPDAWFEYLEAVYDYLFEDGPYPIEDGADDDAYDIDDEDD